MHRMGFNHIPCLVIFMSVARDCKEENEIMEPYVGDINWKTHVALLY